MKALCEEYFSVQKQGKVRYKALLGRIFLLAVTTMLGIAAMSLSAYAYFVHTVATCGNTIRAAEFDVSLTIQDEDGTAVTVNNPETGVYAAELDAGAFQITAEATGTAKTGFCVMQVVGSGESYHLRQMDPDVKAVGFELVLSAPTQVRFQCNWGTSSYYSDYALTGQVSEWYVTDGQTVTPSLPVPAPAEPVQEVTTTPTEETTQPTEETTAPTETTAQPTEETTAPTETVAQYTEETTAPSEEMTRPAEEATQPEETSGDGGQQDEA